MEGNEKRSKKAGVELMDRKKVQFDEGLEKTQPQNVECENGKDVNGKWKKQSARHSLARH